ncbi:hypothetical protein ElyMa_004220900 [Elysia marginata]|uniref:Uncharacterized protein n=1 Tax=Elysia marginata TaxID=1093978 RepID=A0AAV4GPW1_9GAST|nr:hypothetical protein ElyMa_004220900 [Elysia marginata]
MLSEQEKHNCLDVLRLLPTEEIFSLMNTVTNRVVSTRSRKEAIDAILQFTPSVEEFFKRRKISKDLILKYIYLQSWPVPKDRDLHDIIKFIIHKWEKQSRSSSAQRTEAGARRTEASAWRTEADAPRTESSALCVRPQRASEAAILNPIRDRGFNLTQVNNNIRHVYNTTNNYTINVQIQAPAPLAPAQSIACLQSQEQQSAEDFAKWFYSLLNSCNPEMGPRGDFGPQHFWADAQMRLELTTQGRHVSETVNGAEMLAKKLLTFPVVDRLVFKINPGADSVKIRSEGDKKVVLVCGQLRQQGMRVGTFCQSFGLVAGPAMNNSHKVKITLLKMNDKNHSILCLTQDKDAAVMEGLTVSAIQSL